MKINSVKRFICIVLCICVCSVVFSACGGREKSINFMYPFTAKINSYDPQIASTSDEFLIIENTFEGLVRVDDDKTIRKGCAESWSISDDGLTYTFKLKHGLKWNINTDKYEEGENKGKFKDKRLQLLGYEFNPDITAHDFVFALRRAVSPETEAPMFPSVSSIENAAEINSGKMSADKLGVTAADDYTLIIKLSSQDESFMSTLASSVAMPCNEEFFDATKGRYGLETKYTLFNGQFYLSQILETSYLLDKNEYYKGEYPTEISQLALRITGKETDESGSKGVIPRLQSGIYDAAFITGEQSGELDKDSGITLIPYEDTTWAMLLNTSNSVFQSETMREAFCLGLSRLEESDKEYLSNTENLIPSSCELSGKSAAEQIGATVYKQNLDKSVNLWKKGLEIIDETDITITIITTNDMLDPLRQLLQGVQSGIGNIVKNENGDTISFTIKVEGYEEEELESVVAKREYDAALYPFKADGSSPITYLKSFSSSNKTGFDTAAVDSELSKAEKAQSLSDGVYCIQQAEQEIIDSFSIYPMISETSYYATAKGVNGVQFHAGTGRVSFINATRED